MKVFFAAALSLSLIGCSSGLLPEEAVASYVKTRDDFDDAPNYMTVKYRVESSKDLKSIALEFGLALDRLAAINRVPLNWVMKRGAEVILALPSWEQKMLDGLHLVAPADKQSSHTDEQGVVAKEVVEKTKSQPSPIVKDKESDSAEVVLFGWPVPGELNYRVRQLRNSQHKMMEIDISVPSDVLASEQGTVVFAGDHGVLSNTLVISHASGYMTTYSSYRNRTVELGEVVSKGDVVARADKRLSFGIRYKDVPIDPVRYVRPI